MRAHAFDVDDPMAASIATALTRTGMESIQPAVDVGPYKVFMSRNAISAIPATIVSLMPAAR